MAGSASIPLHDETGTGILAGANPKKRRAMKDGSAPGVSLEAAPVTGTSVTTAATAPATPTTAAPLTSTSMGNRAATGTGNPTSGGAPAAGQSPGTTIATTRAPGTTATTRAPGTPATTTSGPAGSSTTATTRPAAPTAPAATTATTQPPAPGPAGSQVSLDDAAGDTFVDGTQKPLKEPRADIVRAGAGYRGGFLAFVMQVQQMVDPRTDERWAGEATFAMWSVDTNGDGTPDYEIQYYVLDGQLNGVVSKPTSPDVLCAIEGGYGPEGYSAIVDPACLGNPASITFRGTMLYDTNPKDADADVASDVTPNGGMSFPIAKP